MSENGSLDTRVRHWQKSRNLTLGILAVWFIFSFVIPWHAKGLNEFSFLGFPLGYYFCVQGSLLVFVILIFVHNKLQDGIDKEAGIKEEESGQEATGDSAS
jgi:putative solute:sodium symporter small subunit